MASAASGRRRRHRESASGGEGKPRGTTLAWSLLSALGGAALLFVGQVAIEEYKASRDASAKAAERQLQQSEQQSRLLDTLFDEYQRLDELPDRAGDYIETGRGGTRSDVLAVVRHFRKVIAYIVSGRLEVAEVGRLYGGRLTYWSRELKRLGSGASPVSQSFSENYRNIYVLLADALGGLVQPAGTAVVAAAGAAAAASEPARVALPQVSLLPRPMALPSVSMLPRPGPVPAPAVLPSPAPADSAAAGAGPSPLDLAAGTIAAAMRPAPERVGAQQRSNDALVARIFIVPDTVEEIPAPEQGETPDAP